MQGTNNMAGFLGFKFLAYRFSTGLTTYLRFREFGQRRSSARVWSNFIHRCGLSEQTSWFCRDLAAFDFVTKSLVSSGCVILWHSDLLKFQAALASTSLLSNAFPRSPISKKICMTNFMFFSGRILTALLLVALAVCPTIGQEVDVYFITGQSNAGNFGEINSNDVQGYNGYNAADFDQQTDAGFNLTFARIRDRNSPVTEVVEAFSSNLLDPVNYAVDNFAVRMNAEFGNDIGVFSYARNGRPLADNPDVTVTAAQAADGIRADAGESWSPDASELYDDFLTWSSDRIAAIEADGTVVNVRGIIWFQGEEDALNSTNSANYQANFEDFVARLRTDFGEPDLAIVASEIRDIGGNDSVINAALNAVAASDDFLTVIDISDTSIYSPESASNVHLNAAGQINLSTDFANEMILLLGGTPDGEGPGGGPGEEPGATEGVTLSTTAPTTDLIDMNLTGGIDSSIFSEAASSNHARGQLFALGDGAGDAFEITAITIRKSTNQTYDNDVLTLHIFEGTESQFSTGTGHSSANDGADFFVDTTVDVLYTEVFTIDGVFANNEYVTLNLTSPLLVDESSDFGFLLTYEPGNGTQDRFRYRESGQTGRLSVTETEHSATQARAFHYAVQGTSVTTCILGDVSMNGIVDFNDIPDFVAVLLGSMFQCQADCNEDGVVDFNDIPIFVDILLNL